MWLEQLFPASHQQGVTTRRALSAGVPHWGFCLLGTRVCSRLLRLRLLLTLLALHLQTSHDATLQLLILLLLIEALQGHKTALRPCRSQFLLCLAAWQGKGHPTANAAK